MVAIVGVTAVLVSEPPARAQVAPTGPYATTAPLGDLELNLVVDPAAAGPQPDPPLPDRPVGTADRRRRGVRLGDARQPGDRPAAPAGAPGRPRPLRRPRRAARARRRLAAPRRDSPRRVRRGVGHRLGPDQKGTPLMKKTLTLLALAAHCSSCRPRAPTSPSTRTRSRPTASPASRSASRTSGRTRTRRRSSLQLPEGLAFVSFQPKPGWTRTRHDGEARQAGHDDDGETVTERDRDGHLGGRHDRARRVRRVRDEREGARPSRRRSSSRRRRRTRTARSSAGSARPTRTRRRRASR